MHIDLSNTQTLHPAIVSTHYEHNNNTNISVFNKWHVRFIEIAFSWTIDCDVLWLNYYTIFIYTKRLLLIYVTVCVRHTIGAQAHC